MLETMPKSNRRFEGGVRYYHRQGAGRGGDDDRALDWNARKRQMDRSRRRQVFLMVSSLMAVLGVVVATFLLMAR